MKENEGSDCPLVSGTLKESEMNIARVNTRVDEIVALNINVLVRLLGVEEGVFKKRLSLNDDLIKD